MCQSSEEFIGCIMKARKIRLVYPCPEQETESNCRVRSFGVEIQQSTAEDIYSTVKKFRKDVFPDLRQADFSGDVIESKVPLSSLINLHNADEIMNRSDIPGMVEKISSGRDVLMPGGLPNSKVAKSEGGDLICFDGHHTILAYMLAGREYLEEIPHLVILGTDEGGLEEREFYVFFGDHAEKLEGRDWLEFTISWSKPPEEQLEKRKQKNMGELLLALKKEPEFDLNPD